MGKWPGNETDEEILEAMKALDNDSDGGPLQTATTPPPSGTTPQPGGPSPSEPYPRQKGEGPVYLVMNFTSGAYLASLERSWTQNGWDAHPFDTWDEAAKHCKCGAAEDLKVVEITRATWESKGAVEYE